MATGNEPNPYSPPDESTFEPTRPQAKCPVCGHPVGRLRYMIPFGHCSGCGNYLKVKNVGPGSWMRSMGPFVIFFGAEVFDWLGLVPFEDFPTLTLLFAYLILLVLYDKAVGTLVPAVWWGFFALDDDEGSGESEQRDT